MGSVRPAKKFFSFSVRGEKRRLKPAMRKADPVVARHLAYAERTISSCSRLIASGFSTNTGLPRSRALFTYPAWLLCRVRMKTASKLGLEISSDGDSAVAKPKPARADSAAAPELVA